MAETTVEEPALQWSLRPKMKLYFCFPYRGVGGVSLLFLRLGTFLADLGHDVTLIDYTDGFMARNLDPSRVRLLSYDDEGPVDIPSDAVLILQAMNPWSMFPGLRVSPSSRLVFWHCMPFNLIPALPGLREQSYRNPWLLAGILRTILAGRRAKNRDLIVSMHAKRSLFFMDDENVSIAMRFLGVLIKDPVLVPIPTLPVESGEPINEAVNRGAAVRLVWVGRIADFKYPILMRVLSDLNELAVRSAGTFRVTIVGSGPYEREVAEHAKQLHGVSTRFIPEVAPSALPAFLRAEADIAVCMGTAALDAARLGVPTILLDASYGPVGPGYRYRWLFEERGFTLGRIIFEGSKYPPGRELGAMFDEFRTDAGRLLEMTVAYVEENHSLHSVAERFLTRLANASYLWSDFAASGASKRDVGYRMFVSIRRLFWRA